MWLVGFPLVFRGHWQSLCTALTAGKLVGSLPVVRAVQRDCQLTHWGRVTHICVANLTIIGSDNGLSPGWRQAITWTNVGILLIGPLGTNFSEILIEIHTFSFKKIHLKLSSAKWGPFCLSLNVLSLPLRLCTETVKESDLIELQKWATV